MRIIWKTREIGTTVGAIQSNELSNFQSLILDMEVQGHGSGGVLQYHQITVRIHQSNHAGQMKITPGQVIYTGKSPELRHVRHAMTRFRGKVGFVLAGRKA